MAQDYEVISGHTKELAQSQSVTATRLKCVFYCGAPLLAKEQEAFGRQLTRLRNNPA
jgi:hypothetical protein